MKANEVMLGDWVQVKHYDGSVEPIKILNIYGNEVNCTTERNRFDVDEIVSGTYMINLYPIPLTAEILEKNGFKKRDEKYQDVFYYYGDLDLRIDNRLEPCGYTLYGIFGLQIKYVHELQHALRLAGIEKEITI